MLTLRIDWDGAFGKSTAEMAPTPAMDALQPGRQGLGGGFRAVERGTKGAGRGPAAWRGRRGRGRRGSERGAISVDFPPPGWRFSRRAAPPLPIDSFAAAGASIVPRAPAPLRDPTQGCWGPIPPLGTPIRRVESWVNKARGFHSAAWFAGFWWAASTGWRICPPSLGSGVSVRALSLCGSDTACTDQ